MFRTKKASVLIFPFRGQNDRNETKSTRVLRFCWIGGNTLNNLIRRPGIPGEISGLKLR